MIGQVGTAVDARICAVALGQIGLERLHHCDLSVGVAAGCDGRPCGAVTPLKSYVTGRYLTNHTASTANHFNI